MVASISKMPCCSILAKIYVLHDRFYSVTVDIMLKERSMASSSITFDLD